MRNYTTILIAATAHYHRHGYIPSTTALQKLCGVSNATVHRWRVTALERGDVTSEGGVYVPKHWRTLAELTPEGALDACCEDGLLVAADALVSWLNARHHAEIAIDNTTGDGSVRDSVDIELGGVDPLSIHADPDLRDEDVAVKMDRMGLPVDVFVALQGLRGGQVEMVSAWLDEDHGVHDRKYQPALEALVDNREALFNAWIKLAEDPDDMVARVDAVVAYGGIEVDELEIRDR